MEQPDASSGAKITKWWQNFVGDLEPDFFKNFWMSKNGSENDPKVGFPFLERSSCGFVIPKFWNSPWGCQGWQPLRVGPWVPVISIRLHPLEAPIGHPQFTSVGGPQNHWVYTCLHTKTWPILDDSWWFMMASVYKSTISQTHDPSISHPVTLISHSAYKTVYTGCPSSSGCPKLAACANHGVSPITKTKFSCKSRL